MLLGRVGGATVEYQSGGAGSLWPGDKQYPSLAMGHLSAPVGFMQSDLAPSLYFCCLGSPDSVPIETCAMGLLRDSLAGFEASGVAWRGPFERRSRSLGRFLMWSSVKWNERVVKSA